MAKKLNEDAIKRELRGSSFFPKKKPDAEVKQVNKVKTHAKSTKVTTPQVPTKNDVRVKTTHSPILGRPKAFYITEKNDEDLDKAVAEMNKRLKGKVGSKIDRSTIMRVILDEQKLGTKETIDRLSRQLVSRLVDQLTS